MKRLSFVVGVGVYVLAVGILSAQQAPQGQAQGQPAAQGQGQGRQGGAQGGAQGGRAGGAQGGAQGGGQAGAQGGRAGGGAGGGRGQAPPTNLQILPRETTAQQIQPIMQQIAAGLGVACNYCHVTAQDAPPPAPAGRDGAPPAAAGGRGGGRGAAAAPMNDFPSDNKMPKRIARTMMLMVRDINSKLGAELGKPAAQVTQVQCVTCHRGVPIPKQLVDIVMDTTAGKNATEAVAQYRDLRKQFYGNQSYDFTDLTLFTAAQRALAAMPAKPDDALAYLQANVEFNPNSARSFQQMSVAYQRKMDMANAIAMLEKAVSLDPMNMQFQNQLNALRNPPQQ